MTFVENAEYRRKSAGLAKISGSPSWFKQDFKNQSGTAVIVPPEVFVGSFEDAIIHGPGIVSTSCGEIILESFSNDRRTRRFDGFYQFAGDQFAARESDWSAIYDMDDRPSLLLRQENDGSYGHWLVECLARVAVASDVFPIADLRVIVRDAGSKMKMVCTDSLALFGIRHEQIKFSAYETLKIKNLVYVAPLSRTPWILSPVAIRALESLVPKLRLRRPDLRWGPERIFISRNRYDGNNRKLLNEETLEARLAARGYHTVYPEEMSLYEQIAAFANAKLVVGNLGGAITNLAFAPCGVRFLALTTEYMQDDFFFDLVCHKEGVYFSLHGKAAEHERGMQSDFTVDIPTALAMLDELEGRVI